MTRYIQLDRDQQILLTNILSFLKEMISGSIAYENYYGSYDQLIYDEHKLRIIKDVNCYSEFERDELIVIRKKFIEYIRITK